MRVTTKLDELDEQLTMIDEECKLKSVCYIYRPGAEEIISVQSLKRVVEITR